MILDGVLKSDITLFTFLSLTALLGWTYPSVETSLGTKYSPLTLTIIEAVVVITTLLVGGLFVEKERLGKVIKDMRNMTPHEYAIQIMLGIIGTGVGLVGTAIIQHHDIGKFQIYDYAVTILASAIGVYMFMRHELTLKKIIGLIAIAMGGYVFSQ
jgi:drug/metabolite transporter (DMT)-like permease